jgi:hypothetical protein
MRKPRRTSTACSLRTTRSSGLDRAADSRFRPALQVMGRCADLSPSTSYETWRAERRAPLAIRLSVRSCSIATGRPSTGRSPSTACASRSSCGSRSSTGARTASGSSSTGTATSHQSTRVPQAGQATGLAPPACTATSGARSATTSSNRPEPTKITIYGWNTRQGYLRDVTGNRGLVVPGRPIRFRVQRTGAAQASATWQDRAGRRPGTGPHWGHSWPANSGQPRSPAVHRFGRSSGSLGRPSKPGRPPTRFHTAEAPRVWDDAGSRGGRRQP